MARKLDTAQQEELSAFVDALASVAGYTSTSEWSRDSGYDRSGLSDLRNRNGAIDGYNLLRLIRAAAERASIPEDVLALATSRIVTPRGSEEVAATQRELRAALAEVRALLAAVKADSP